MFAHSMGNIVVSNALRKVAVAGTGKIVNVYIASQAAVSANLNDRTVSPYNGRYWNVQATEGGYPTDYLGYFSGSPFLGTINQAVASCVNFFNPQDEAMAMWLINNFAKQDGVAGQLSDYRDLGPVFRFKPRGPRAMLVTIAQRPYGILSYVAQSRSKPIGSTSVGGPLSGNVDLTDPGFAADHSGQFDSTNAARAKYWKQLLTSFNVQHEILIYTPDWYGGIASGDYCTRC